MWRQFFEAGCTAKGRILSFAKKRNRIKILYGSADGNAVSIRTQNALT